MRIKTKIEKRFNVLAKNYGRKAYTAIQFDNEIDLQKALKSFEASEKFVLKDDLSNFDEFTSDHHIFLESKDDYFNDKNQLKNSETIEYTQKLFKITNMQTAEKIAAEEYYDTWTNGYTTYVDENGEQMANAEIQESIDKFHNFCINVDNSKKFIKNYFPRWGNFTIKEKEDAKIEIKKLIDNLEILRIDTKALKVTYHFITKYERLNQDEKFKAKILLYLQLPNIDKLPIAKEIVKYLKLT